MSFERARPGSSTDPESGAPESRGDHEGERMSEIAQSEPEQAAPSARPAAKRTQPKTAAAAAGSSTRTPTPRKRTTAAKTTKARTVKAVVETVPAVAEPPEPVRPAPAVDTRPSVLTVHGLSKRYGSIVAVDGVSLDVREGSFYGIVGPNGAGKTTTLSMITGLLRPDEGRIVVHGVDAWTEPVRAKHVIGVLPDKLRLFDRLTGAQFLHYAGTLRGLSAKTVHARTADLANAFGIADALDRLVADYSAGMTKKIALAAAMIHSPRLLVLDEPFESVDPVSAANVVDILQRYTAAGGTVVLSSHGMDMIERVCDSVAIIVRGQVLAAGTIDEVRGEQTLEERFVDLAGGRKAAEGMEWLHSFSD
ncbi:ATP-binding cassette domain-containing protein [Microbacterium sp. X-17]|uniref:ABC transporter ATP-binding protein n=1 Tax=Microbacterium sp. X-17 TaxID=3144404 RepID=UPI0031F57434